MQRGTNLTTIAEHTVDLSLLPEKANILDLGCRGFLFGNYFYNLYHHVYSVDIGKFPGHYHRMAITDFNGFAYIKESRDPQAIRIVKNKAKDATEVITCMTLDTFTPFCGVRGSWDIIKMDIEGAEYEVIMSLTEPPATQLSIEFHLHTKIYGDAEVRQMEDKLLSLGYFPVKHDKTNAHGCGQNYWDSLFILQK